MVFGPVQIGLFGAGPVVAECVGRCDSEPARPGFGMRAALFYRDNQPSLAGESVQMRLFWAISDNCVMPCGLPEPLRAELKGAFQGVEVDVDQAEPVAEAGEPFEVVLGAPVEVPVHRHALRGRPLELAQAGAQEHYPVGVIDVAVPG